MTLPNDHPPEEPSREEAEKTAQAAERANNRKTDRIRKTDWFGLSSAIVGFVAALASGLSAAAVQFQYFENVAARLAFQVHWIVFVLGFVTLYVGVSYVITRFVRIKGFVAFIFRIPSWVELRNFGDQRLARISYMALAFIPLVAFVLVENPFAWEWLGKMKVPLNFKISFFIAFFFSFALITFTMGCPKELHRRNPLQGAKNVNLVLTSVTRTNIAIEERDEYYDTRIDESKIEVRAFCWLFYTLGLALSLILLIRAARFVLYA